ncbi:MAG: hypothetical protein JSW07_13380, partial [bacterium]
MDKHKRITQIFVVYLIVFMSVFAFSLKTFAGTKDKGTSTGMKDIKVTVASMKSILIDTQRNLEQVRKACVIAKDSGARIVFLPECMLTGHGGHPKMIENAEPVPDGPLSQSVLKMSEEYQLCICVGIAELSNNLVYNSQMV